MKYVKKIFCNKLCKKHYNQGQLRKTEKFIFKSYMNFISNEQYMTIKISMVICLHGHYGQNRMEKLNHEWKTYHFLIIHQKNIGYIKS